MQSRTNSMALVGIKAERIEVQCQLTPGPHSIQIVGLPGAAVREARDRIAAAFYALQIALPPSKVLFNLAPSDLPKFGNHFDLPMAVALLSTLELVPLDALADAIVIGSLNLDASIAPVKGALPSALLAIEEGRAIVCPKANFDELSFLENVETLAPGNLTQIIQHYRGTPIIVPETSNDDAEAKPKGKQTDFRQIKGLDAPRRAIEIAAAGRHHIFMLGAPGAGKSMLAEALRTILPPFTKEEVFENMMIASTTGQAVDRHYRPYRDPHHSASMAALIGGGREADAGEITFANHGILFLDELPEFSRDALEALRTPLETQKVSIARANAHVEYPASFQLVAAANPCSCGMMFNAENWCGRAPNCGKTYLARISGPLLDRFSIRIMVSPIPVNELATQPNGEPSEAIRARVIAARERQYARNGQGVTNEDMAHELIENLIASAQPEVVDHIQSISMALKLSPRGYFRLIKTAITIADLNAQPPLAIADLNEAVALRVLDTNNCSYSTIHAAQPYQTTSGEPSGLRVIAGRNGK